MTNFAKLKKLLEELFQMDQADLDFGIFRIMNAKRDEVSEFLDKDLLPQVKEAFGEYKSSDKVEIQKELDELVQSVTNAGLNPDDSPKVQELRQILSDSSVDVEALENEVFSHLYNFFRRYYHEGDFISLRRYKKDVYAIPYEGEEVKLHWANHDQYYIKSSEYLRDYIFILDSGMRVRVHLVAASTEQDNKKAAPGKERRFVLCAKDPIFEENGELYIRFEYRADDSKKKQAVLNQAAIERIVEVLEADKFKDSKWANEVTKLAPTPSNKDRTVLEKHLSKYTARHTFDYFIHKDLGGFLRRELDFYIKNEVMHLDDIESDTVPRVEQYLSKIKVIRKIGHKLIQFLDQLETFQKKLWLKKKFVTETNYCMTLDLIPEALYPAIASNDTQRHVWVEQFAIDQMEHEQGQTAYSKPLKVEFLKHHTNLILDTQFFEPAFKARLLGSIEDIHRNTIGLLIDGDNFAALSLIRSRYAARIQTLCIDPPYNTGDDGFAYKDQFVHSSWIAMIQDRFMSALPLLCETGTAFTNIDDNEYPNLWNILTQVFGSQNYLGSMVWKRRSASAMSSKPLSLDHEYVLAYGKNERETKLYGLARSEDNFPLVDDKTGKRFASDNLTVGMTREQRPNQYFPITNPRTGKVFQPNPSRVWRFFPETMAEVIADDKILWPDEVEGNLTRPRYKTFFDPENMKPKPCSSWIETNNVNDREIEEDENEFALEILKSGMNSEGSRVVDNIFGKKPFAYPKPLSLVRSLIRASTRNDDCVLDFFAGSGTTGHAVIDINREDQGLRQFILVEMGEYFNSVLKPRILKVLYSRKWRKGAPVDRVGVSGIVKYIRLESYEDALNNLEMKRSGQQELALESDSEAKEQYTLSYMLDVESEGSQSLLNVNGFRNPDEYKLKVERNGETQLINVDLVETFNWLLGLTVKHIDAIGTKETGKIRTVEGTSPDGEKVLVLWRNLDETNNEVLEKWFAKQGYNSRDQEYDMIYINGDNNIENLRKDDETWKVRLIEEEFGRLMFDVEDV